MHWEEKGGEIQLGMPLKGVLGNGRDGGPGNVSRQSAQKQS